jgi:uncharacterized membrane protein
VDRIVRAVVGVALIAAAYLLLSGVVGYVAGLVGLILIATAAVGFCPIYGLLNISTAKHNK